MNLKKNRILVFLIILLVSRVCSVANYDPQAGRFLQRDPLGTGPIVVHDSAGPRFILTSGPVVANPNLSQYRDGMNLYEYVKSNPIILTDPLGGCSESFSPGINVTTAATATGKCGGAFYGVRWIIPEEYYQSSGYIIQHVEFELDATDCRGYPLFLEFDKNDPSVYYQYWEAWSFEGSTVSNTSPTDGGSDYFIIPDRECTRGSASISGLAKGITDYALPSDFEVKNAAPAGPLPMTTTKPKGWHDPEGPSGTAHSMKVEWDCCGSGWDPVIKPTTITASP